MKKNLVFIILLFLVSFSCSVKKRSYRKGYYIDWVFNKKDNKKQASVVKSSELKEEVPTEVDEVKIFSSEEVLASVHEKNSLKTELKKKKQTDFFNEECGDIITFKKGETVKAKVLEIGVSEIKYKRCDNLEGPLIVVNKKDIYSIKYLSGHEDHFFNEPVKKETSETGKKETHPLAIAAIACTAGILIFNVFAAIAALIIASIAKQKIMAEPDKYEGLDLVKISQIISTIAVVLFIIIFALFMVLLFSI